MRTGLIAGLAVLVVAVIFIIQNAHAANISFLGVHLILPLAAALFLAAIAGALLMAAAGPALLSGSPTSGRSSGVPCAGPVPAKQPTTGSPPMPPPPRVAA
jgi:putative membrane protein